MADGVHKHIEVWQGGFSRGYVNPSALRVQIYKITDKSVRLLTTLTMRFWICQNNQEEDIGHHTLRFITGVAHNTYYGLLFF